MNKITLRSLIDLYGVPLRCSSNEENYAFTVTNFLPETGEIWWTSDSRSKSTVLKKITDERFPQEYVIDLNAPRKVQR